MNVKLLFRVILILTLPFWYGVSPWEFHLASSFTRDVKLGTSSIEVPRLCGQTSALGMKSPATLKRSRVQNLKFSLLKYWELLVYVLAPNLTFPSARSAGLATLCIQYCTGTYQQAHA